MGTDKRKHTHVVAYTPHTCRYCQHNQSRGYLLVLVSETFNFIDASWCLSFLIIRRMLPAFSTQCDTHTQAVCMAPSCELMFGSTIWQKVTMHVTWPPAQKKKKTAPVITCVWQSCHVCVGAVKRFLDVRTGSSSTVCRSVSPRPLIPRSVPDPFSSVHPLTGRSDRLTQARLPHRPH